MQVKGFLKINSLISNIPGVIAPIGELSLYSETFSKERGYYQPSINNDYDLVTFLSVDNVNQPIVLTDTQVNKIVSICIFLRLTIASTVPPYDINNIKTSMFNQFPSDIGVLEIGDLVSVMPQWISWTTPNNQETYTIWFQDMAFRNQYEHFDIVVVDPLPDMTIFTQNLGSINAALTDETADKLSVRINTARNNNPETVLKIIKFPYADVNNPGIIVDVYWPVLIYGLAGDHIDAIKDAIINRLNQLNFLNQSQWGERFPDIYRRTEFIVVPAWNKIAIPNMLTQEGIYSQILKPEEITELSKSVIDFYDEQYVEDNTYSVPTIFKGLTLSITNGMGNITGLEDFREVYPDYVPLPTSSLDFNRMTLETQDMHRLIHDLVTYAETMTRYSFLPDETRRIQRGSRYYIAKMLHGINFIVLPKAEL